MKSRTLAARCWMNRLDKLGKQYKTGSTELYDRLKALFTVIDQGSDELNMPTYNGGLFSQETDSGQFLATYAIPDRYLALGLDRLTRDVDDRTQGARVHRLQIARRTAFGQHL